MSRTTSARSIGRLGLVGLAGIVLALTACTPRPGAAAVVGDARITDDQVQSATAEVLEIATQLGASGVGPDDINRRQINRMVTDELIVVAAQRAGVTATDAEVEALIAEASIGQERDVFIREFTVSQQVPPSEFTDYVRTVVLNRKLLTSGPAGQSEQEATAALVSRLGELSTELDTAVSPRYGSWDPADLSVTLPPNDLSKPQPLDPKDGELQIIEGSSQAN